MDPWRLHRRAHPAESDAAPGATPLHPRRRGCYKQAMYLIEFLLPVYDNEGTPFSKDEFENVRHELTERFGGVTAFMRSPAMGQWADDTGTVRHDDLAGFEVMTDTLDREWWRAYRQRLCQRFRQQEIVVRASGFERL
jgi:hypothetical protein